MTGQQALEALVDYIDAYHKLESADLKIARTKGDEDGKRVATGRLFLLSGLSVKAKDLLASIDE